MHLRFVILLAMLVGNASPTAAFQLPSFLPPLATGHRSLNCARPLLAGTRSGYSSARMSASYQVDSTFPQEDMDDVANKRKALHKYWWPVLLESDVSADRPHAVKLLGKHLVVWHDKQTWRCADDKCKHRFAPLSEGRVMPSGCIQCSYHGWTFDNNGVIDNVPQVEAQKKNQVQSNRFSKLKTYPCTVAAGMIFVYPDASEGAFERASRQHVPVSPVLHKAGSSGGFMRDLPYGYEILCENLIDLAHLPFR
jgi:pheophorbide a oxygenase